MKKQQEHQMKQYEKLIDQIFKNAMKKKNNEEGNKVIAGHFWTQCPKV